MDVFCDNNTMHVIYLDRIGYYCVLSIVLCFLLFQDTTHKAKEKEKGKSPNPVSKMNDIPFLVVYLQRHKSMAVGWKCWSHALLHLWTKILCQAETFSCNRVRWRTFNENYIEPMENRNANYYFKNSVTISQFSNFLWGKSWTALHNLWNILWNLQMSLNIWL